MFLFSVNISILYGAVDPVVPAGHGAETGGAGAGPQEQGQVGT